MIQINFRLLLLLFLSISLATIIPVTPIYAPSDGGSGGDGSGRGDSGGDSNSGGEGGDGDSDSGESEADSADSEADSAAADCDASDPSCSCTDSLGPTDATTEDEEKSTGIFGAISSAFNAFGDMVAAIGGKIGLSPTVSRAVASLIGLAISGFTISAVATTVVGYVAEHAVGKLAEMEKEKTGIFSETTTAATKATTPSTTIGDEKDKENSESMYRAGLNDVSTIIAKSVHATGQPIIH